MRSPEAWIGAMRSALTRLGVQATRTPEVVDALLGSRVGTARMAINPRCGRAAGRIRPGIALALKHTMTTVCVGGDLEATARVREGWQDDPPSSPAGARYRIVGTAGG
jgi:putative YphP/YqiW family bacilliredoxin